MRHCAICDVDVPKGKWGHHVRVNGPHHFKVFAYASSLEEF